MKKRLFKQIVSIVLALMMVIGMLPMDMVSALATGEYSEAGPLTGELLLDGEAKDVTKVVGSTITLEGLGMGGTENYEYKFAVLNVDTGVWTVLRDFSTDSVCEFKLNYAGKRQFALTVRDTNGNTYAANRITVDVVKYLTIDEVEIMGVEVPMDGSTPDINVVLPEDAPYEIVNNGASTGNNVYWSLTDSLDIMEQTDTFSDNKSYTVRFCIAPKEGYGFAMENGLSKVDSKVNGQKAFVENTESSSECIWVGYEFSKVNTNEGVIISGIELFDGQYLESNGLAVTKEQPESNYAYYNDGKLTLNNFTHERVGEYGIVKYSDMDIELLGSNSTDTICTGDTCTIMGDGFLSINDEYGILSFGGINFYGGTIMVNTSGVGIFFETDMIVDGAQMVYVSASGTGNAILGNEGSEIKVLDGQVFASGENYCIECCDIDTSNYCIVNVSEEQYGSVSLWDGVTDISTYKSVRIDEPEEFAAVLTANGYVIDSKIDVEDVTVVLEASATGGSGDYTYKFAVLDVASGVWTLLRDFSKDEYYVYSFDKAGKKQFALTVKDSDGNTVAAQRVMVEAVEKQRIEIAEIGVIEVPIAYNMPDTEVELPLDAPFEIYDIDDKDVRNGIHWNPASDSTYFLEEDEEFSLAERYTVGFVIKAKEGYRFNNSMVKINGQVASVSEISGYDESQVVYVEYTFGSTDREEGIIIDGIELMDGDYLAYDGKGVKKASDIDKPTDNYAYYSEGVLTLKNFKRERTAGYGIFSFGNMNINLIGENETDKIICFGALTFDGTGSLYIEDLQGIYCSDVVSFNRGKVIVKASESCIASAYQIVIDGGNVELNAVGEGFVVNGAATEIIFKNGRYVLKGEQYGTSDCSYAELPEGVSVKVAYILGDNLEEWDGTTQIVLFNHIEITNELSAVLRGNKKTEDLVMKQGSSIMLEVDVVGGSGDYTYKFAVLNVDTEKWSILQDFNSNSRYVFKLNYPGKKEFAVTVKDSYGTTVATNRICVNVIKNEQLKGTLTVAGTTEELTKEVGSSVKLDASAIGGSGDYTYKFAVLNVDTGKWSVLQDFKDNSSYTFALKYTGVKQFAVTVKDSSGTTVATNRITVNVVVSEKPLNAVITVDGSEEEKTIAIGKTIAINIAATGGAGGYKYKLVVYDVNNNTWTTIKDYSNAFSFNATPTKVGTYQYVASVKDSKGNTVSTKRITVKVNKRLIVR